MTKTKINRFRLIYKILLSISIIAAGICFIAGSIYIFYSGNGYSRQIVANTFLKINIPIYLCLLLVVGDIVWELISPSKTEKTSFKRKSESVPQSAPTDKKTKIVRLLLLCIAVALLIFGFATGGYADVLTKAINICTECIGLG